MAGNNILSADGLLTFADTVTTSCLKRSATVPYFRCLSFEGKPAFQMRTRHASNKPQDHNKKMLKREKTSPLSLHFTHPSSFHIRCQHDNQGGLLFPHHLPEIRTCVRQWALRCDVAVEDAGFRNVHLKRTRKEGTFLAF